MRRGTSAGLVAAALIVLAGCGGGGGGKANDKASWQKDNGSLVTAFSKDIDDAITTITQGERNATVASCTQVQDDGNELRTKATPVPNATVDGALKKAIDLANQAAADCLKGAKNTDAREVEAAQREFPDARKALNDAQSAINAWT